VANNEAVSASPFFPLQPIMFSQKQWRPAYKRVKLKYSLALFWHPVLQ